MKKTYELINERLESVDFNQIGVLMLLTLDQLNIDFESEIEEKKYISDFLEFHLSDFEVRRIEGIEAIVRTKLDENKKHVEDFFEKNYEEITFDKIVGFNPMGAIRYENKLLIKHLMIIEKDGVEQTLNGYFCLMFDNAREWIALYKEM